MSGRPSSPLLSPDQAARLLDGVIFTRVAELIDLPRLYDLEAMIALQIESLGADRDRGRALAKAMIDRALLRVAVVDSPTGPKVNASVLPWLEKEGASLKGDEILALQVPDTERAGEGKPRTIYDRRDGAQPVGSPEETRTFLREESLPGGEHVFQWRNTDTGKFYIGKTSRLDRPLKFHALKAG